MRKVIIGPATLYRADCRDVLPEISPGSVPMIFTDPPYGHNNNNNGDLIHRREAALGRLPCRETSPLGRPILNDGPEANGLVQWLFGEAARVLRRDSCCCCCGGGGPDPQFARWSLWMDKALAFDQMVIWDKGKIGMGWKYRRSYETVLVGHRKSGKMRWFDDSKRIENIIRPGDHGIKKIIPQKGQHPTLKPIELPAHFMKLHTKRGDLVLDPFMGSGTTGVAALQLGRRFIGIEKDPKYFKIACARIRAAVKEQSLKRAA